MIDELHAQDVALIRDADITFADGLTVITGESGSGKTALLTALKLLVGERANADMVREGAPGLAVEGRFFTDDGQEDGHIALRKVDVRGRGRVSMDGSISSVKELAATLGATVDLCGQHEHQGLLSVASHVELLDAWIGQQAQEALAQYNQALSGARAAAEELKRLQDLASVASERLEQARFERDRIDEVNPAAGELEELDRDLPVAENAETLREAANDAYECVLADDGVSDRLGSAVRELRQAADVDDTLAKLADALESAQLEAEDAAAELRAYRDKVDLDPTALRAMQGRQAALQGLMRTFGPTMDDVFSRRQAAQEIIDAAEGTGTAEREAQEALEAAEKILASAADHLIKVRQQKAPLLAAAITGQMARLSMGTASVELAVEVLDRREWTQAGPTSVELMYRPGEGMTLRPLRKVASGGEISRVMLACKVVLGEADRVETLVFDEVDAGVGGTTAVALATVLKDLARTHQVICVTHLPQVAVMGDSHYVVSKVEVDGVPETQLTQVENEGRVDEIARMLAGDRTESSRAYAKELLTRQGA